VSERIAPVGLVIIGAGGRMGAELLRLLSEFPALRLVCAVGNPARTSSTGAGIAMTPGFPADLAGVDVVLDFSVAEAAPGNVRHCANSGWPLLLGTTGVDPGLAGLVEEAARRIPILVAPNTSLGATVLAGLVRQAAAMLGTGFEVSIRDKHHQGKRDAPSGTALALGAEVQGGSAVGGRPVAYASVREGDVVGEHEVRFQDGGEWIRLSHGVTDRSVFARGALQAGSWLARQRPGSYRMTDALEEK